MKKLFILLPLLWSILLLSACQTKTYDIVVTLFPQYDMVRTIVGNKDLSYTMLLAPGVEAHGFEPTSKQVGLVQKSALFIYTSDELETWAPSMKNKGVVVNLEALTESMHADAHPNEAAHEHDLDDHDHDVHYWVSVHHQIHMIEAVLSVIIVLDPENTLYYEANALTLNNQLLDLSASFTGLSHLERPLYFIGHNVFSALNEEFGLNIISLTESYSPKSDPTSAQIGQMIAEIRTNGATYVYFDPFENDAIAKTIKADLKTAYAYDVTLLPLHSMHNVSKKQFEKRLTLIDLWTESFSNIEFTSKVGS